jgi:hypothetical protein
MSQAAEDRSPQSDQEGQHGRASNLEGDSTIRPRLMGPTSGLGRMGALFWIMRV